jgi:hypothetical protein
MKTRMCPSASSAPGRLGRCSRIQSWPAALCRTERPDTRPHAGGASSQNYLAKPRAFTHGHMTAFVPPLNSCKVALESRAVPHMTRSYSSTPCNVKICFDVSIDIRLNSIGTALSWWSVARPHLGTIRCSGPFYPNNSQWYSTDLGFR